MECVGIWCGQVNGHDALSGKFSVAVLVFFPLPQDRGHCARPWAIDAHDANGLRIDLGLHFPCFSGRAMVTLAMLSPRVSMASAACSKLFIGLDLDRRERASPRS